MKIDFLLILCLPAGQAGLCLQMKKKSNWSQIVTGLKT